MGSNAFSRVAATIDTTKNLETTLIGAPYLDDSQPHDVSISAIDLSKLESEDKFDVHFVDEQGRQHRDSMFVLAGEDSKEFSASLRWLIAGCIPDDASMKQFYEIAATDPTVLEAFTGMKMRITLAYGKGCKAHALGDGTFVAFDPAIVDEVTGQPIPQTAAFPSLDALYTAMKATNVKRAYVRVKRIEATHKEENLLAFAAAVAALKKPASTPAI